MGYSLGELAARLGCELRGDPDAEVDRVATLQLAGEGSVSFLSNPIYRPQLESTSATAVAVTPDAAEHCPTNALVAPDPYLLYAKIAAVLHPDPTPPPGIHASASVHPSATLAEGCHVAANASIGENCRIEANCYIGPGVVVDDDVSLGEGTRLLANCTVMHGVSIGKRSIIHPGAVIGADGFGNAQSPDGWVKVPQIGSVRIGDDVEIGANTTVDRGAIDDTIIGNGVRLDNLVQIAHNVHVGDHTAMASMVGIAGSSKIGQRCLLAGMSGLVGHISICDDVVIGGATMVTKDIVRPGFYTASFPAEPDREWKRQVARFRRLEELTQRVRKLEKDGKNK